MMERLVERVRRLGARIEIESWVQALVRDGERIVGVRYHRSGAERSARARKGVILATGHFTNNPEMLRRFAPFLLDERYERQYTPNDDGAGILLGLAAGGEALHMAGALITYPFYPPERLLQGILVNRLGRRFVEEDVYHSRSSIEITQQPDGVAYLIVDDECFGRPEFGGWEVVDAWEDVATMEADLGMPAGALQRTIREYNENAARGEDPEFHKYRKWLRPLDKPPFAALRGSLGSGPYRTFTLGGLRVSRDGEVLRPDGSAIAGLYAAGACASNIAQDGKGYSSGTCIGESTYFGRRAGRHAAA
jgi:succinate dehydrogenase/fumarate reductase flavoprotein subunit